MRALIQRVSEASVAVGDETVGSIGAGLVVLLGIVDGDGAADVDATVDKIAGLRIFSDEDGKMNRSVADAGGSVLVVSQFTLAADVRKGRRPSFTRAAPPDVAEPLVERAVARFGDLGIPTATGRFRAMMAVRLVNDGPVTIVVDATDGRVL